MQRMERTANFGLIIALIAPLILVSLIFELNIPIRIAVDVSLIFLSSLIAALLGHSVLRMQKRQSSEQTGRIKKKAVTAIILGYLELFLLGAATVFPHIDVSKLAANEASAVGSLRHLSEAATRYAENHPQEGFPKEVGLLASVPGKPDELWTIDASLASGQRAGYRFKYVADRADNSDRIQHYKIFADPIEQDKTGVRHFYVDDTGVIRWSIKGPADSESESLQ